MSDENGTGTVQPAETLSVLFTQSETVGSKAASVFERVTNLVPYRFALESLGDDLTAVAAPGDIRLSGTCVCRL